MSKTEPTYQNEEQHSSFQGLQANRKLKKVAKNCSHQNSITTDKDRACEKKKTSNQFAVSQLCFAIFTAGNSSMSTAMVFLITLQQLSKRTKSNNISEVL